MSNPLIEKKVTNLPSFAEDSASSFKAIKVAYKLSKAFEEGVAKVGDFYAGDTGYGSEILIAPITFRFEFVARDKDGSFIEAINFNNSSTEDAIFASENYKNFTTKHKDDDIDTTVTFLVFNPAEQEFQLLPLQKKLKRNNAVGKLVDAAYEQRIVKISTIKKEWKNFSWFELSIEPTDTAFDLSSLDKLNEAVEAFNKDVIDA